MSFSKKIRKHAFSYAAGIYVVLASALCFATGGQSFSIITVVSLGVLLAFVIRLFVLAQDLTIRQAENYRQTEALISLASIIRLTAPLPPMRGWSASPDYCALIASLICEHKPRKIVEFGSGVSTVIAAYCLKQNECGSIISIEQSAAYAEKTRSQIARHHLEETSEIRTAPLTEIDLHGEKRRWYDPAQFADITDIDMVIVDGPSMRGQELRRYPALPLLSDRLTAGAVIILDDSKRTDEIRCVKRWLAEYSNMTCEYFPTEKGTAILRMDKS